MIMHNFIGTKYTNPDADLDHGNWSKPDQPEPATSGFLVDQLMNKKIISRKC